MMQCFKNVNYSKMKIQIELNEEAAKELGGILSISMGALDRAINDCPKDIKEMQRSKKVLEKRLETARGGLETKFYESLIIQADKSISYILENQSVNERSRKIIIGIAEQVKVKSIETFIIE